MFDDLLDTGIRITTFKIADNYVVAARTLRFDYSIRIFEHSVNFFSLFILFALASYYS